MKYLSICRVKRDLGLREGIVKLVACFYSYLFCYPDGIPYYAGAGTKLRIQNAKRRNAYAERIRLKINKQGRQIVKIIFEHSSREEAIIDEKRLIKLYGRWDNGTGILAILQMVEMVLLEEL